MLVLYNFEKAFNEIKNLPVVGNFDEYIKFLKELKKRIPNAFGLGDFDDLHPVLWTIIDTNINKCRNKWFFYNNDYPVTNSVRETREYDEEFNFTELFEDLVGAI